MTDEETPVADAVVTEGLPAWSIHFLDAYLLERSGKTLKMLERLNNPYAKREMKIIVDAARKNVQTILQAGVDEKTALASSAIMRKAADQICKAFGFMLTVGV